MEARMPRGTGLGFRRELIAELQQGVPSQIDFFEIAPENWAGVGGASARTLRAFTERHTFVCHGLSLSLGGSLALDLDLLTRIKAFMREHGIGMYTEHLSWTSDSSRLYDLLPLPFTEEAVQWTAQRIRQTQDVLGMPIAIENASAYILHADAQMSEWGFIRAVLEEADCQLHLDVNNLYVNSQNFHYDPLLALDGLPLERTTYIHIAGHLVEPDGLRVDTHGEAVVAPVWDLLDEVYRRIGPVPTCLERDANIPPLAELMPELQQISTAQARHRQPETV